MSEPDLYDDADIQAAYLRFKQAFEALDAQFEIGIVDLERYYDEQAGRLRVAFIAEVAIARQAQEGN